MKPLLSQQENSIRQLKEWKVGALFMEAGTGKTRVACELIREVSDIDLVVWIAPLQTIRPKSGIASVKDEIEKWAGLQAPVLYIGVESISLSNKTYLNLRDCILKAQKPFIVVDESLKIKNADAIRTKRVLELGKLAEYKLILNGTPLSRNLLDLWAQMEFISPKILNMTLNQFKNTFCKYTTITKKFVNSYKTYSKEFITGYENIDYLYSLIRHYVFQCDLNLNISQNYNILHFSLNDKSREEYFRLKNKYLDDEMLQWKNDNIFLEMTQKMQHAYCKDDEKFLVVNRLFKSIPECETIIFCKYIDSRKECERRYPQARVLSYQKEAFGLNMQQYHYTVYFDKIWDLALRTQSGRRTFRVGQEYDCYYYDLTGDVGLERMIDRNIENKVCITEYFKKISMEELREEL